MADTLSELLLQELSSERADALLLEVCSDTTIVVDESPDLTFVHYVLDGSVQLDTDGLEDPLTLHSGESAIAIYGSGHRIWASGNPPPSREHHVHNWPNQDEPLSEKVGEGGSAARILSAAVHVSHRPNRRIHVHPVPELVPIKHDAKSPFAMRSLFSDTSRIAEVCSGPGANAFINALMNLQLTHFLRCSFDQIKESGSVEKVWFTKTRHVGAAMRILKRHPERNWTVENLASELGYSRSTFANLFRAHTGMGPMGYLGKVRMELAAGLLRNTPDLSIQLVARRSGFSSATSFSRAFKTYHGESPRAYCCRIVKAVS